MGSHNKILCLLISILAATAIILQPTHARLRIPKNSEELQSALDNAKEGDTIELLPIDYIGDFVISTSGISRSPILLFGHFDASLSKEQPTTSAPPTRSENIANAIANANNNLTTSSTTAAPEIRINSTNIFCLEETALTILGSYWNIKNLNISCGTEEGIVLQNSNDNKLESLAVQNARTAILLDNSNGNLFGSISISDVIDGILVQQGSSNYFRDIAWSNVSTGISIHSGEKNRLHNLAVHGSARITTGLLLSEQSCCGVLTNTIFSGLAEVHGNNYNLRQTIVYGGVNVLGCNNSFTRSIFNQVYFRPDCFNKQVSQNIYHITAQQQIKDL